MHDAKILPGTGRGTICKMVEGASLLDASRLASAPSTGFAGPPPRSGEEL